MLTFGDLGAFASKILRGGLLQWAAVFIVDRMVGSRRVGGLFGDLVEDVGLSVFFRGVLRHDDGCCLGTKRFVF